jgi:hypothetical protein
MKHKLRMLIFRIPLLYPTVSSQQILFFGDFVVP